MPIDATHTKTEKNDVLQAVIKYKFNPADFKWVETILREPNAFRGVRVGETEFTASKLIHVPTQYYMTFGGYTITWSPGITRKVDQEAHEDLWLSKVPRLEAWLNILRADVDAPDLWEAFVKEQTLAKLSGSEEEDNRPFTKQEKDYIADHLKEIKQYLISTQETNAEKQRFIESRIDYLIEASERMGRKDWHITLMGIVATLVIAAVVTPERAQELFRIITDAFLPLFQSLLQLEG